MLNKKAKMFLLFSLVIITMVGLTTITAADVDDTTDAIAQDTSTNVIADTPATSDNNIQEKQTKAVEKTAKTDGETGTFEELGQKINSTTGTLTLDKDYSSTEYGTEITIDKTITIDGDGNTIYSVDTTFNIASTGDLTLKNAILTGKNASYGIFINSGKLTLENVTVKDIIQRGSNSASVVEGKALSTTILNNCVVTNVTNSSETSTPALRFYANSTCTITNSSFSYINSSLTPIRAYAADVTLTLINSTFKNFISGSFGGVIYYQYKGILIIDNCVFENNVAPYRGGAIYSKANTTITNSVFRNNSMSNTASQYNKGGVIWFDQSGSYYYLENNIMEDNVATMADNEIHVENGDINSTVIVTVLDKNYDEGDTVILEATVTDDMNNTIGGKTVTFTVGDKTFTGTLVNGTATATATTLEVDNKYTVSALYSNAPANVQTVTNGTVEYGNVLPNMTNYTTLQNVTDNNTNRTSFKLNNDITRAEDEISVSFNRDLEIDGKGKTIDANNGRIFTIDNGATVTLKNLVIKNTGDDTTSTSSGTIADIINGNLILENVNITNSSTKDGYSIPSLINVRSGSSLTTDNVIVTLTNGTVIFNQANTILNNTKIANSITQQYGIITNNANLIIDNSVIENTTGKNGIVYSNDANSEITVTNSIFNSNSNRYGGAIVGKKSTTIDNTTFTNNVATIGGALYVTNGVMNVTNSIFVNNKATDNGSISFTGRNGKLNISTSILLSDDDSVPYIFSNDETAKEILDNNYWGTNESPIETGKVNEIYENIYIDEFDEEQLDYAEIDVTLTRWVIMDTTITEDPEDNTVFAIDTTFNKAVDADDNKYDLENTIPDYLNITYTTTSGTLASEEIAVANGEAHNTYYAGTEATTIEVRTLNQVQEFEIAAPVITGANYKGLQMLIDATAEDGTLTLEEDCLRGANDEKLVINKNMVVDGAGYTINAKEGRIFEIANATVTLKNMVLTNASYTYGGAVNATNATVILDNVTIKDSILTGSTYNYCVIGVDGDAVITINNSNINNINGTTIQNRGKVVINNSNITDNYGANILYNYKNLEMYNTNYSNNTGTSKNLYSYQIAYNNKANLTIDNCTFENNVITGYSAQGGALYIVGNATISNSKFINNSAETTSTSPYASLHGGAIYDSGNTTITKTLFQDNKAINGSAIFVASGSYLTITDSAIISNMSDTSRIYNRNDDEELIATDLWWGSNDNPSRFVQTYSSYYYEAEIDTSSWIIMEATCESEANTHTVTTTLNKVKDTTGTVSDYTGSLPDGLEVSYTTSTGTLAAETTLLENGVTTNTIISEEVPIINVTQANQKIVLNKPTNITITDETYPLYFDETGVPLETLDGIIVIKLSGEFNNRLFTLTAPVNLTSDEDQAVLKNSAIILSTGVEGTNITNLIINNTDYDQDAITIMYTSGISLINNTIIQDNTEGSAKAIVIDTSSNIVIDSNNINVTGISKSITYEGYAMWGFADTSAIQAYNSSNNQITNNNISVKASKKFDESKIDDTITAINIAGEFSYTTYQIVYANENTISNNNINIEGISYAYAIRASGYNDENTITNNEITSTALNAYGVDVNGPASENYVNNNTITVTAPEIAYGIILSTNNMGSVTDNEVNYNTITATANDAYGIEFYQADENSVEYNVINANGNFSIGIGMYMADENTIRYNNITVNGDTSQTPTETADVVQPDTAGILFSGGKNGNQPSDDNIIVGNIITVTDVAEDATKYAVILSGSDNTVRNNTLVGTKTQGDKSVFSDDDNTINNNLPSCDVNIEVLSYEPIVYAGNLINIPVAVTDSQTNPVTYGEVMFTYGNGAYVVNLDENGQAVLEVAAEQLGQTEIGIVYVENGMYNQASTTAAIEVVLTPTTTTVEDVTAFINETFTIVATVVDADENAVLSGYVIFEDGDGMFLGNVTLDENGQAVLESTSEISVNTTISATYYDDAELYAESSDTANLVINKIETSIVLDDFTVTVGEEATLTAHLTDVYGDPLSEGKVTFKVNGKVLRDDNGKIVYATVNEDGVATASYVAPKTWLTANITANYMGTAGYDTSKSEAVTPTLSQDDTLTLNVEVTPTTVSAGSTIQITATVKEGSTDVNAGKIIFKLNGKTLKDDQGKIIYGKLAEGPVSFSYTIPNTMKAGTYNLVATYSDINYGKLNQTVEITVA